MSEPWLIPPEQVKKELELRRKEWPNYYVDQILKGNFITDEYRKIWIDAGIKEKIKRI